MDKLLPILGGVALLIILIFPLLPIGTRPRCPQCRGRKIGIQKTPSGMRVNDFSGGGGGGSSVQMQYEIKYRCNDCQTQWSATATETR